jgi:hypothetical protein
MIEIAAAIDVGGARRREDETSLQLVEGRLI